MDEREGLADQFEAARKPRPAPGEALVEDVCPVRIPGLKGNRPGRISDPRAVDKDLLATLAGHAVQVWSAAEFDDWLSRHCQLVSGGSSDSADARGRGSLSAGDLRPLQTGD